MQDFVVEFRITDLIFSLSTIILTYKVEELSMKNRSWGYQEIKQRAIEIKKGM